MRVIGFLLAIVVLAEAAILKRAPEHFYTRAWSEGFETIAVVATNDIHGSVFKHKLRRTDNLEMYSQGGLSLLGTMLTTLRKQLGKSNVMYFDAGDQFQGAIESGPLISKGEIISTFFNEVGLTASAIGNH
jgi:2',3'-cyclic-nucleotide 2'-phosphodiesterase (5'-nucleotidase family)